MIKPPVEATLVWTRDLQFLATSGTAELALDGNGVVGLSPVQTLAISLAGCMATDIVSILVKGRHPLRTFRSFVAAERAPEEPRRIVRATLHFAIGGDVPHTAIERAIALSREKYCSVWHSMRTDMELQTTFEVQP